MAKVIVIGRNYTSRLGMIRALGRAGHDVFVIQTNNTDDIDARSRYVKEYYKAVEPNREQLVELIWAIGGECEEKFIIMPVDDYAASVIDDNVDNLKGQFLFPNINMKSGAVNRLMNKDLQKKMAKEAGFQVAEGWVVNIINGKYIIPDNIVYPCFPKPQISITGNKTCMKCCNSKTELTLVIERLITNFPNCSLLVEQYIHIEHEYATLGFSDGKNVVLPGMVEMLESSRTHKGVTLKGKIMPPDDFDEFFKRIRSFIRELNFVGLFDVDSYESNGKIYFNELNLRFGASGYSVTNSGINLPGMFVSFLLGNSYEINPKISVTSTFVNEKYIKDDVLKGYISYIGKRDRLKSSDFKFIYDEDDPLPYKYFNSNHKFNYRSFIKFLLRWLKLR